MKTSLVFLDTAGITTPILIGAALALAVVLVVAALFIMRSGKKKKDVAKMAPSGNADWQRAQPGAWNQQGQDNAGAWNQQQAQQGGWNNPAQAQQSANAWGTPQAPTQQASNPWGTPDAPAQQQQQQANPWGTPQQAPNQQSANPWGTPEALAQQQQQANPWGTPQQAPIQQQQQANPWSTPQQAPNQQSSGSWGNQPAQTPWEATPPPVQPGANWGAQPNSNNPSPLQQGPSSFSGTANASWAQPQPQPTTDPWNTPSNQTANPPASPFQSPSSGNNTPAWQQQGGFAQPSNADNDKTMLRSGGLPFVPQGAPQGTGLGTVRIEEGKEPGRVYEVRKESLSIGRSRESDIFLEDLAVSRLHASIVNMGNGNYVLKDEGSANGTKINGQQVPKFQTCQLQEGDRIQLGQTVLVFARK